MKICRSIRHICFYSYGIGDKNEYKKNKNISHYEFEFTQNELLESGGSESEQLEYMENKAREFISNHTKTDDFDTTDIYYYFSYNENPSFLTVII